MDKSMNTKKKRASVGNQHNKNLGEGLRPNTGSPLSTTKLQTALERCADRELALTLEVYDLKLRLKDAMACCKTFFHVAGKRAEESWAQFEKAANMYQRLRKKEDRP
jgi:hypothetical protein